MPFLRAPSRLALVLALTAGGLLPPASIAGDEPQPPALKGFDPVDVCEGRETPGDPAREAVRGAYRYLFATDATRERFLAEPERWEIQWDGACARMGPASGKGDPARWLVHAGRIYIFASEDCRSTFAKEPEAFFESDEEAPKGADAERAEGRRLLDLAVKAIGGAERLDAMTALHLEYEQPSGSPGLTLTTEIDWRFPSRVRRHRAYGGRWPETHVVTPDDAFVRTAEGVQTLHPTARREVERIVRRNPLVLLRARREPGFVAVAAGAVAGGAAPSAAVEIGYLGLKATLTIEREGGRILGLAYRGRTKSGAFGRLEERFSDWRDVSGIQMPFRRDVSHQGVDLVPGGVVMSSARVNDALPEAQFRR